MPAAAAVAVVGVAGAIMSSQAQKSAAKKAAKASTQNTNAAIEAQERAEQRAYEAYEPFRQIGVRAATPVSDSQWKQMTGNYESTMGQIANGYRISGTGTPYKIHGGGNALSSGGFNQGVSRSINRGLGTGYGGKIGIGNNNIQSKDFSSLGASGNSNARPTVRRSGNMGINPYAGRNMGINPSAGYMIGNDNFRSAISKLAQ